MAAALDRIGRLSPTDRMRALNNALIAAGGTDPDSRRNAVTMLQAAQRLDDVPADLRAEIGTALRATLAPAEMRTAAEDLATQASFVGHLRRNAVDTMAEIAKEVR